MPAKEDKVKTNKKTMPKKTVRKSQSKTKSRTDAAAAKKKTHSSAARKKRSRGNIIAALAILCVLLLGFNLVLVLKLVPNLKENVQSNASAVHTQVEQKVPLSEQKRDKPLTAKKKDIPPNTAPQVSAQIPKSGVQQTEHIAAKSEAAENKHLKQAPSVRKDTVQKEKSAVRPALQKNTVPEKSIAPDKKNTMPEKNTVPAVPDKKKNTQPVQSAQLAAQPEKPRKYAPYAGKLTFVFDDAGHNLDQLEHFLRLPFPCTIAVLPGLRYSSESARRIRKAGKQVILHQPMQSVDLHINPGPGAVTPGLSAEQIKNIVRKNLEEIWPVAGMNNHEGSLMTADEAAMSAVLDVVAEKHIFFLDSRTTARSVVAKVAKEKNMTVWERAIFIDNDKSRAAMETQIKKGLSIARQKGSAIMIGHVFTVELAQLLTEMYPTLIEEGFSLSAIAQAAQKDH